MAIKVEKPEIFALDEPIQAFFTLKNKKSSGDNDRNIEGFNLGFNTEEAPEVVRENRALLLDAFDIDPDWIAFANQVHSNRVKEVADGGTFAETDSLVTQVRGLALAIQVADCASILIADLQSSTIAAVHAGWRGAAGDIVPRTIEKMMKLGVNPAECKAFISPCISIKNFEVGQEVADLFPAAFVDEESYAKPHLDLKGFLADQLRAAGLRQARIEVHPGCTMEDPRYYSYRREGEQSGRMMALIKIEREGL